MSPLEPPDDPASLLARARQAIAGSDYPAARELSEQALLLARSVGAGEIEVTLLNLLGMVERRTGGVEAGLKVHGEALELAREKDLRDEMVAALNGLAHLDRVRGAYESALERDGEALAISAGLGRRDEQAISHNGMGSTLEKLGRYDEALEHYSRCLEIVEETGNRRLHAYACGNIAIIRQRLGDNTGALAYELQSLRFKEEMGDRWGLGVSYNNIGLIYKMLGEYAGALEAFLRSLHLAEQIGDREGESVALNNIGQIYEMLGDRARVIDYYTRSLGIATGIGYSQGIAFSLTHIGRYYESLGDNARALLHYLKSLRMHQQSGDRYGEREAQKDVGYIYLKLGEHASAAEYLLHSLEIARDIRDREGEVVALMRFGELERDRGALGDAMRCFEEARALAADMGYGNLECDLLGLLAETAASVGDPAASARYRDRQRERTRRLFNEETTGRVRELIFDFEGDHARRQGEELGLDEEDLAQVGAAIRKGSRRVNGEPPVTMEESREPEAIVPEIEVITLGEFRVIVGGVELGSSQWKRKRARELFKLLLVNHRKAMTIDEIMEILWGGIAERNVEMLVMNTVSHIRSALEPGRGVRTASSYLHSGDRTYMLDMGERSSVDFLRFKELTVAARRSQAPADRRRYYRDAVDLYRGDFLKEDLYAEWSMAERELLKDAYLEGLEFLASDHLRSGEVDQAIDAARRTLASDSTSERAWEVLFLALRQLGRAGEAAKVIAECERVYSIELGSVVPERLRGVFAR